MLFNKIFASEVNLALSSSDARLCSPSLTNSRYAALALCLLLPNCPKTNSTVTNSGTSAIPAVALAARIQDIHHRAFVKQRVAEMLIQRISQDAVRHQRVLVVCARPREHHVREMARLIVG